MERSPDRVYSVVRSADGRVLAARFSTDGPEAPWALPAGPVVDGGVRQSAVHWCRAVLGIDVIAGHLISLRFLPDGATAFAFEAALPRAGASVPVPRRASAAPRRGDSGGGPDGTGEFTAHEGAVVGRFFPVEDLLGRLGEFESRLLAASLHGLEGARVVEWSEDGEFSVPAVASRRRMMPILPEPYGPKPVEDPARAGRARLSRIR